MCRRVTCSSCGKPTFAGCGAHVEQVLGDVPKDQRCQCREQGARRPSGDRPTAASTSILDRLFGR
jgi:hypothetical protein